MLAEWTTEAAMRIGVPLLTLGHSLLAMALVLNFGNITGRRGASGALTIIAIPAAHILFLVALQSLLRRMRASWLCSRPWRCWKFWVRPGLSRG